MILKINTLSEASNTRKKKESEEGKANTVLPVSQVFPFRLVPSRLVDDRKVCIMTAGFGFCLLAGLSETFFPPFVCRLSVYTFWNSNRKQRTEHTDASAAFPSSSKRGEEHNAAVRTSVEYILVFFPAIRLQYFCVLQDYDFALLHCF